MEQQLELTKNGLSRNVEQYQTLENFTKIINATPPPSSIQKTPDGNAETMGISFIEAKLDEVYLGQWGTEDVTVSQIANEVIMTLTLWVIHPLTKMKITRTGCAAVQIMVDKRPDTIKDQRERNAWALDMQNKKPNALYLAFPKLKSLATKNAAQTLGNTFGRNLNRKYEDTPDAFYENLMQSEASLTDAIKELKQATTKEQFGEIWNKYTALHESTEFKKEFLYHQRTNVKAK